MIDIDHLCPGCMGRWEDTKKPCPRCGFSWEMKNPGERELPPFTILAGRYLLGVKIGAGGFGITYLAMDLEKEHPVAIKEFFPFSLAEREEERVKALPGEDGRYFREALRSFRKEAELLSRFRDVEGIVHYQDYVQENETAYLVMEYVEGVNLRQKMRQMEGAFSQEEALELLYPILLAVDAMHGKKVLHRDISPENLILKPDGTLTLIDFGAAREYTLDEDENLTVILKHGYAPDEQYHSGSRQGPWTDLYACCAVLYQMVSGLLPQDAASRREKDLLLPLDEIEDLKVTEEFARAIEKGMTIYATERYPSIGKLLADLDPEGKLKEKRKKALQDAQDKDTELTAALAAVQTYREQNTGKETEAKETAGNEPEEDPGKSGWKKLLVIAAVFFLPILVMIIIYRSTTTVVPDLDGMTEEEARQEIEDAFSGEAEVEVYYEYDDDTEEGLVFSQYPYSDERVQKKGEIELYVSKGRGVEVPDITLLSTEEALSLLEPDFSVETAYEEYDAAYSGQVISQSLEYGEIVGEGETIRITIAVPDLTGYAETDAEQELTDLGLDFTVDRQYSDEVEKDYVMDFQLDSEYQSASLIVSDGPEFVQVPDLRGMSEEEAQAAASELGLTAVLRNDKELYSQYGRGKVAYQHLDPGTEVNVGTRIYYDTSAGVPASTGITLEASTTSVTLKRGGDSVAVTFYTNTSGGCICYTPGGINAQMGAWYEGQPFKIYLSAEENSISGMTQVYIYTGKMAQGTDVVVDYVNIDCTVVD